MVDDRFYGWLTAHQVVIFDERHLRHVLLSMKYDDEARTHLSLNQDAPAPRRLSRIVAYGRPNLFFAEASASRHWNDFS
jgi:hypothetical protein